MANPYIGTPQGSIWEQEEKRKKLRDAMLAQSMKARGTEYAGNQAVRQSPLEGIGRLAQMYLLSKGQKDSDKRLEEIGQEYSSEKEKASQAVMEAMLGKDAVPASQISPMQEEGFIGTGMQEQPAVEPDYVKAATMAASSPYLKDSGMDAISLAMLKNKFPSSPRSDYSTIKEITVDGKTIPVTFNTRTRETHLLDGTPFTGRLPDETSVTAPKYDPTVKKSLEKAGEEGTLEAQLALKPSVEAAVQQAKSEEKRSFNMTGINDALDEAESILDTGKPTQSFVGAGWDFVNRAVGTVPEGATEAAQLEALGGALTAKMPRMEGPQSDKDALLYRQMAGQIGDKTQPIEVRKAAIKTVRDIWARYEHLNSDKKSSGNTGIPDGVDPKDWEYMSDEDKALFQ